MIPIKGKIIKLKKELEDKYQDVLLHFTAWATSFVPKRALIQSPQQSWSS